MPLPLVLPLHHLDPHRDPTAVHFGCDKVRVGNRWKTPVKINLVKGTMAEKKRSTMPATLMPGRLRSTLPIVISDWGALPPIVRWIVAAARASESSFHSAL